MEAVRFIAKSASFWMRLFGRILGPAFMKDFWTTVPGRKPTIYYPAYADTKDAGSTVWHRRHADIIDHEMIHVSQGLRWGLALFIWLYFGFTPLPVLLSWGRWRIEREGYMTHLRSHPGDVEWVVQTLSSAYARPWPQKWMRRWFLRQLGN